MLAIAKGEHKPAGDEPKVWFTSIESLAEVLSAKNRMLLELIAHSKPASISELAVLSGRARSNLWRTLRTMEAYRLVELHQAARGRVEPRLTYEKLNLDVDLGELLESPFQSNPDDRTAQESGVACDAVHSSRGAASPR